MTLRLNGSTSGYVELDSPATGDSSTILLPTGGNGTLGRMQLATAQNTTSGTSIDFTGIPSWVKRVTVMFNGVSLTGSDLLLIQIGTSSGVETTGYKSVNYYAAATGADSSTSGFIAGVYNQQGSTANTHQGSAVLTTLGGNAWVCQGVIAIRDNNNGPCSFAGGKTLSGVLDRVRITTNGTNSFDAGSINILYEG